jgi:hypothetical protein
MLSFHGGSLRAKLYLLSVSADTFSSAFLSLYYVFVLLLWGKVFSESLIEIYCFLIVHFRIFVSLKLIYIGSLKPVQLLKYFISLLIVIVSSPCCLIKTTILHLFRENCPWPYARSLSFISCQGSLYLLWLNVSYSSLGFQNVFPSC